MCPGNETPGWHNFVEVDNKKNQQDFQNSHNGSNLKIGLQIFTYFVFVDFDLSKNQKILFEIHFSSEHRHTSAENICTFRV